MELLDVLPSLVVADWSAAVQEDAADFLPVPVRPIVRPASSGVVRVAHGLRNLGPADLVHGLDVDLPARWRGPSVITVHDLSVFDASWATSRLRAAGERRLLTRWIARADAVLAVSAFTAERVLARFGREATVTLLGTPSGFAPASAEDCERVRRIYGLPEAFVLHLGTLEPRKDVAGLAAACRTADAPFVLAGLVPAGVIAPPGALVLGPVPADDRAALYSAATVVAFPSRYEGFGLPPLEAMACGAAVVATPVGALPDVLGDAARFVPVGDTTALAAVIRELLRDVDQRRALSKAGRQRAGMFTWHATATATAAVYRSLGIG